MILLSAPARVIQQILIHRIRYLDRAIDLDYQLAEFDDVRYHIQASLNDAKTMLFSIAIPSPPPEVILSGGLPLGAMDAVKASCGIIAQIIDPPESGFHLTLKLDLSKLPPDEEDRIQLMIRVACLRAIIMGAPLRDVLKHLLARVVLPKTDQLMAVLHRPGESFFVIPQPDKVVVVFPMRFKDHNDSILATAFLQEFMETRRTGGLHNAPPCQWSLPPPTELKSAQISALDANAGFVSFVILPRHVEGDKLDSTVWNLCTFHAFVSYHVKCSKAFMHTRMRRRMDALIKTLNQAKPQVEEKTLTQGWSFRRH